MRIKALLAEILMGMAACCLGACSFTQPGASSNQDTQVTGLVVSTAGIYDSEDTALVIKKDTENSTIQYENLATGKRYTLHYDGATTLLDKYDQAVSLEQIEVGSIVTVRFYKPGKQLAYMKIAPDSVTFSDLSNYKLDTKAGTIDIADTSYNLSNHLLVFSDGQEAELIDVNQMDVLDVWGWNNQIYGINIVKGHGYLRLQNDTYFIDGWIEVGQSVIRQITEDMLLVVPEGLSTVKVSHNGSSAVQEIDFKRNQEMAWDLADVEIVKPKTGKIIFTVTPTEATVAIDGANIDVSSVVELEYGIHQMTVTAKDYDTVAQYIRVGEPSANISIELEKSEKETREQTEEEAEEKSSDEKTEKEESSKSQTSEQASSEETSKTKESTSEQSESSQSSTTDTTSRGASYKVHIDSPAGVEVYLDGNYVGIAPVDFTKTPGNYVISLRKSGYQTRSYTLQIDDEEKDVTYSFSELTRLDS